MPLGFGFGLGVRGRRGGGAGGGAVTLAAEPAKRGALLSANAISGVYQSWDADPANADRVGYYAMGAPGSALLPRSFGEIFTFSRASKAWDFDAFGLLGEVAAGNIRQGYGLSGAPAGWLLEGPSITNGVRNPRGEGAALGIVGAGGSGGTNILITDPRSLGITAEIVGIGGEAGIGGFDVRYYGTANVSSAARNTHEANNAIAAAAGQTWTHSGYTRLLAGALNGATLQYEIREYVSGVGGTIGGLLISPTSAALATQRFSHTRTLTDAGTTHVQPTFRIGITNGVTYDFTLRFGGFQCEQNYLASSLILPPVGAPAAAVRVADALSIGGNSFAAIFGSGAPSGFVIADVLMPQTPGAAAQAVCDISDGTASNRIPLRTISATALGVVPVVGGVSGTAFNASVWTAGTVFRVGMRWGSGALAICLNGGAISGGGVTLPTGLTTLTIGNNATNTQVLNGRALGLWAGPNGAAITDAKFQAACTLAADPVAVLA